MKTPKAVKSEVKPGPANTMPGGYLAFDYHISRVEGKILTLIEGLGFHDSQEKAVKDLARDIIQSLYRDTTYLYGESVGAALDMNYTYTKPGSDTLVATGHPPSYTPAF